MPRKGTKRVKGHFRTSGPADRLLGGKSQHVKEHYRKKRKK